jgi:hypothetical protein
MGGFAGGGDWHTIMMRGGFAASRQIPPCKIQMMNKGESHTSTTHT